MAILQPTVQNISVNDPQPLVGQVLVKSQNKNTSFYSSKIINYVESIEIDGILKTVFFTEVNTNVNVGDKVFIVNGNYDSDQLIKNNKYGKFTDGYRILGVNGCRIILDIDYTGQLPYEEYTSRNFIYIHNIENQKDFDYINSIKISADGSKQLKNIFSGEIDISGNLVLQSQNIVFASTNFNGGISGPGFWIKDDEINNTWADVTSQILGNLIKQNANFSNSGNLFIVGNSFKFEQFEFRSKNVYKYENYSWVVDVRYYDSYLSKNNFRYGKFKGIHNDGVFGSYLKKLFWDSASWNSGVLINTDWIAGYMNSKHTVDELSYSCKIQQVGSVSTIVQSEDVTNNRGFGYNFIENCNFLNFSISNGNFYNCIFITQSNYKSALDIYYGNGTSFTNIMNGGKYEMCEIYDVTGNGSYYLNSLVENSNLNRSKLVSSGVVSSSMDKSFWSSEGGIKILGADMWSYDYKEGTILNGTQSDIDGTIKLFISEEDYFKLNKGDAFYISKLNKEVIYNLIGDEERILTGIETRYLIDNYNDYDINSGKRSNIKVSISSANENRWKHFVKSSTLTSTTYEYFIDGNLPYWYKIPMNIDESNGLEPQLRYGGWNSDYATSSTPYILGDFVYLYDLYSPNSSVWKFYIYWPINKGDVPGDNNVGWRAVDLEQAELYGQSCRQFGPEDDNGFGIGSDWIWVGTFSTGVYTDLSNPINGLWDRFATYSGGYLQETQNPYFPPGVPFGNIVRDNDIDSNFYIFVGGDLGATNSGTTSSVGVVSVDYLSENFVTQSNISSPSINISSDLFGWYLDSNDNVSFYKKNKINPISPNNINNLFVNTVLTNGEFKSGVMENSTWLSGDHSNYYNNIIKKKTNTTPQIFLDIYNSKKILKIYLINSKLSDVYSFDGYDFKVGEFLWIKSIMGGDISGKVRSIDGVYKVIKSTFSGEVWVESVGPVDKLIDLIPGATDFYLVGGNNNNYLSVHKSSISNSKITSGKFRRTGIDNTIFENDLFKKYVYPASDLINTELIRLVNIMFQNTNNEIKSGLVYKSHFINDKMNGGTFYNSIWLGATFSDGLFKSSVWTYGYFNGGRFVDSRESTIFSFDFDTAKNNKLWQGGYFNGGEFYNSLWVRGTFSGGRFYYSDWTGGTWNNGVLGSSNLRSIDTTMAYYSPTTSFGATFTVWNNGLVENAVVGGDGRIDWYDGKMIGGEFTSNDRRSDNYSVWHDGDFYGSSFTKQAWWKNGSFYSGKFQSEIGWSGSNIFTHSNDPYDYGWVDGYLLGGEFGNGSTQSNSIWYDGVMEGGVFKGRFWRDGVMTNGKFYGSLVTQSDISQSLVPYRNDFYGLWNGGHVNNILHDIKTDRIVVSIQKDVVSKNTKPVLRSADFDGVLWLSGTFSHELSNFNNSVWIGGEFKSGNFNNSYFNPFVDLTLVNLFLNDYSFNLSDTCIWTGGNFNSGEFNYSKWLGGNFNDGTINGAIWRDGVFNYGFMNNCYWENGTWRNGNWNGSPFDYKSLSLNGSDWEVTEKNVDQILKNISNYAGNQKIHLNNVLTFDPDPNKTERVHTFDASGFTRWVVDEQK